MQDYAILGIAVMHNTAGIESTANTKAIFDNV